ncbi:MAG: hypothetical protein WB699_07175 [Bacteroidota bacterium]
MQGTKRSMRRVVLSKLFEHLKENYGLDWSEEIFDENRVSVHQLDAVLAFKSDFVLDELCSALNRLEEGTYGVCIRCKSPMGEEILDDDPTRRLCPSCARSFTHVHPDIRDTQFHTFHHV